ncbi:MAG: DNA repair protein RadC [Pseudomonadales bacterium]
METVEPSSDRHETSTTLEQENRLINEAKNLLYQRLTTRDQVLKSPQDVQSYLCFQLSEQQREVFCCLFLDSQYRLIEFREMFFGTIDGCAVYPREVVKAALQVNAAAVAFAHNHPSGIAEPSQADRRITERLRDGLSLMDIRVLDHFVIGDGEMVSFAERGWI